MVDCECFGEAERGARSTEDIRRNRSSRFFISHYSKRQAAEHLVRHIAGCHHQQYRELIVLFSVVDPTSASVCAKSLAEKLMLDCKTPEESLQKKLNSLQGTILRLISHFLGQSTQEKPVVPVETAPAPATATPAPASKHRGILSDDLDMGKDGTLV